VCGGEPRRVFNVREHNRDLRTEQALFADCFCDGKKVRASAGEEDAQAMHLKIPFPWF
jgi:hypothetical protein